MELQILAIQPAAVKGSPENAIKNHNEVRNSLGYFSLWTNTFQSCLDKQFNYGYV
jgi:hypothetical protein